MRSYRLTLMSCCGLGLMLALACSDEKVRFDDTSASQARGAITAGTSGQGPSEPGDATGSLPDADVPDDSGAIDLPPSVSMTPAGTLLCGSAPCACNNGVDDD